MADFNAKLGSDNRGYEEIMGQYGLGEMNENGERLLTYAYVPQANWSYEVVSSNTEGYTKRLGYHQTYIQRIRLNTCASGRDSRELFKMCMSGEEELYREDKPTLGV